MFQGREEREEERGKGFAQGSYKKVTFLYVFGKTWFWFSKRWVVKTCGHSFPFIVENEGLNLINLWPSTADLEEVEGKRGWRVGFEVNVLMFAPPENGRGKLFHGWNSKSFAEITLWTEIRYGEEWLFMEIEKTLDWISRYPFSLFPFFGGRERNRRNKVITCYCLSRNPPILGGKYLRSRNLSKNLLTNIIHSTR